jgi:hypothetical protein
MEGAPKGDGPCVPEEKAQPRGPLSLDYRKDPQLPYRLEGPDNLRAAGVIRQRGEPHPRDRASPAPAWRLALFALLRQQVTESAAPAAAPPHARPSPARHATRSRFHEVRLTTAARR